MDIGHAQEAFVRLLGNIKAEDKKAFLQWMSTEYSFRNATGCSGGLETVGENSSLLDSVAADLRGTLPLNCLAPEEPTFYPHRGQVRLRNAGLSPLSTLHVDAFLYPTDEDVDFLCAQLGIGRSLCTECGSWKTKPLDFISHSMSREQLQYVFCHLVTNLSGKVVLDIGSRLGTVLWGGYVYSQAVKLIGIEKNPFFYDLQCQVISKYNLGGRVEVLCADVCNMPNLLNEADVIILNNVFEFFCTPETEVKIWTFLYAHVRKRGTILVTIPSIYDSTNLLTIESPLDIGRWVAEIPLTDASTHDNEDDLNNIHLYCVL